MEHKDFEREVPQGFREIYHIDAANKKTGLLMTLGAFVIMVVVVVLLFKGLRGSFSISIISGQIGTYYKFFAIWLALSAAYIILHELTHGAVYKALTHQKLRFGITWSAAFCGVPDIYVYRRVALASLVAPLTLFTIILLPLTIWLRTVSTPWYLVIGFLFAEHFSGCVGDMYVTFLFLTKYKDPRTLMRDTGPEQWMYAPEEEQIFSSTEDRLEAPEE